MTLISLDRVCFLAVCVVLTLLQLEEQIVFPVKCGALKSHSREMYNTQDPNVAFIIFILWLCHVTLRISDAVQVIQQIPPEIVFNLLF